MILGGKMMTKCWIIYNGSLIIDKFQDQAILMEEAVKAFGVETKILKNYEVLMDLSSSLTEKPDFVIMFDKDILLAKYLKQQGIMVVNEPEVIERCDNKAIQYLELSEHGIPMPKTIIGPKIYKNFKIREDYYIKNVIKELGLPLILKEGHGSFGMKVYLLHSEEEIQQKLEEISGVDFVFQQFIKSSYGRDIRVNVIGDKIVAAMYRESQTDFRANITNGGSATTIELTDAQKEIAINAAKCLGAEYAGVDLLFDENEEPIVCEVNAAAHIRNIYNVTGINVGYELTKYILKKLDQNA